MGRHNAESVQLFEQMKKKDEKKNTEEMHLVKVAQMIKSAEGSAGLLHENLQA